MVTIKNINININIVTLLKNVTIDNYITLSCF